ncbi:MAG: hypothetical protein OXH53_09475 [bacterium]|nr:hypothetical protein [bacterium]
MDDTGYMLTISGAGLSVEQQIDRPTALAILNVLLRDEASQPVGTPSDSSTQAAALTSRSEPRGSDAGRSNEATPSLGISVGEFVVQVGARRNPDKIVAMGVYLKKLGKDEFQADDIKPMFQQAGEPTPANFGRDWRWAQNAKWIAPTSGSDKHFYVTNSGLTAVEEGFPPEVRKQTALPSGKRTRRKASNEAE